MKLSKRMIDFLRWVDSDPRGFVRCANSGGTINALVRRGLLERGRDRSGHLERITDAGRAALVE
jgi:hypothetical protein